MSDKKEFYEKILENITEQLADIEHKRWAKWQKYVHDKSKKEPDGSLIIPAELVSHWERQINTPYSDLSSEEKESDKEQVKEYLPIILKALTEKGE